MKSSFKSGIDKIGICTSSVCAVHCLITPFIVMAFPFAGLAFLESEGIEIGILLLSLLLAMVSLVFSFLRKHRNTTPLIVAGFGFGLFTIGKLIHFEVIEVVFSILGGTLVVIAHYRNIILNRQIEMR